MSAPSQSETRVESPTRPSQRRSDQTYDSLLPQDAPAAEPHRTRVAPERSPRIAPTDVFNAADALLAQGDRPTIDRVRMRLGRGSPNTINEHLDRWWANLGGRIADLPGRAFPQVPEAVGKHLLLLWNEALQSARDSTGQAIAQRETALADAEKAVDAQRAQLLQDGQAATARTALMDESLALARAQLTEASRHASVLEEALQERESELSRLRANADRGAEEHARLIEKLERERAAYRSERAELEKRHEAAESRWLIEIDRTRQTLKQAERLAHEAQVAGERAMREREHLKLETHGLKSELKLTAAVRVQLEARLRAATKLAARRLPARRAIRKKSEQ
jgi:hypothetical protein